MTALEAFVQAANELEQLATKIERLIDRFPDDPSKIHWGHVGDLNFIKERLREIIEHYE